jgi:peptidyl-prolyl cis-trans isomerase A (cyclophilin A)
MFRTLIARLRITGLVLLLGLGPMAASAEETAPRVRVETSMGALTLELWPAQAPATVENFLAYVDRGFYDGLVFHRVIPGFMIQTGGYDAALGYREPSGNVVNESVGGPPNRRGTIAMARRRNPDSANSQFFVNVTDNPHLDAEDTRPGYTVFGQIVEGMDVVDRIALVPTGVREGMRDVPLEPVIITAMRRVDG